MKRALAKLSLFFIVVIASSCQAKAQDFSSTSRIAQVNNLDTIVFDLGSASFNNDYVKFPVYILSDDTVNALDFSLKFDESVLSYDSTINPTAYLSSLAFYNPGDHTYRFTSSSMQQIENHKNLIEIQFIMLNGKRDIHSFDFSTLKGYLNGDPCSIKIVEGVWLGQNDLDKDKPMFSLYPNPADNILNIMAEENVNVVMYDMSGREMRTPFSMQAHQRESINTERMAAGIYILKIYNDNFVSTEQIVIHK